MLDEEKINLARNPFASQLDISKISDDFRDKILEIKNNSSAYDLFVKKPLNFGFLCNGHMQKLIWVHLKSLPALSPLTYVNVDFLHLFKSKQKRGINLMFKIT